MSDATSDTETVVDEQCFFCKTSLEMVPCPVLHCDKIFLPKACRQHIEKTHKMNLPCDNSIYECSTCHLAFHGICLKEVSKPKRLRCPHHCTGNTVKRRVKCHFGTCMEDADCPGDYRCHKRWNQKHGVCRTVREVERLYIGDLKEEQQEVLEQIKKNKAEQRLQKGRPRRNKEAAVTRPVTTGGEETVPPLVLPPAQQTQSNNWQSVWLH